MNFITKEFTRNPEEHEYYATSPKTTEALLNVETFQQHILEPACGEGHISKVLQEYGYTVQSSDLVDRNYGTVQNFFTIDKWDGDIITNPPFTLGLQFVKHALDILQLGAKLALLLRIQFLGGKKRGQMFKNTPPQRILVSQSGAFNTARNGDFEKYQKQMFMMLCWFVWIKGSPEPTTVRWVV